MSQPGFKKQVFGSVVFSFGILNTVMDKILGIKMDFFYVALIVIGICLFIYGTLLNKYCASDTNTQRHQNKHESLSD